jgi:hypothetical protein
MNRHSGINDNNKKDRTKATAAIPMVGAIVTAALLLSGLSLIGSYQSAIAQIEDLTGGGTTEGGGATTGGTEGATTGGNATTAGGNATTAGGNATTAGGNATTAGGNATTAGLNQTTASEVILHLEEVRTALEGDDTETALMHVDLALMELGANTTTTAEGEEGEEGEEGGEGGEGEEGEEGEG